MTQEEKAQRYDEAIKKAKDMLSYKEVRREDMEYLFPALKESEDERIRKEIIIYLKSILSNKKYGDKFIEDWIAWLENQGKNNMGISETTKQKLEDNLNKALEKETPESLGKFFDEQKPYGQREECVNCQFNYAGECKGSCAMKRGEQILANSAKTCKDEQKPAWSEEDEKMYALTLLSLAGFMGNGDKMDWLKSLKGRYTWKPSEEQIMYIGEAIDLAEKSEKFSVVSVLKDIREQLKKLRER